MGSLDQIKIIARLSLFLILAGCGGSEHHSTYIISDTMEKKAEPPVPQQEPKR